MATLTQENWQKKFPVGSRWTIQNGTATYMVVDHDPYDREGTEVVKVVNFYGDLYWLDKNGGCDSFDLGTRIYDLTPEQNEVVDVEKTETKYSLSLERDNIRVAMTNEGGHQALAIGMTVDKETTVLVLTKEQEDNLMELYHSLRAKRP